MTRNDRAYSKRLRSQWHSLPLASRLRLAAAIALTGAVLASAPARAQQAPFEILATQVSLNFVDAISAAVSSKNASVPPAVTVTHSAPGLHRFCTLVGPSPIRIVVTTMTIPPAEAENCVEIGISTLVEVKLGFLAMVLVQKASDPALNLSPREIYLALAEQVPQEDGFTTNTASRWSDIKATLPETAIKFFLPSPARGSRKVFDAEIMIAGCRKFAAAQEIYKAMDRTASCATIRPSLIAEIDDYPARLAALRAAEPGATAMVTINDYMGNQNWLRAIPFDGFLPTPNAIHAEDYNLAAPVYVYAKLDDVSESVEGGKIKQWLEEALSERAIGPGGYLEAQGLTILPDAVRESQRNSLPE